MKLAEERRSSHFSSHCEEESFVVGFLSKISEIVKKDVSLSLFFKQFFGKGTGIGVNDKNNFLNYELPTYFMVCLRNQ